MVRVDKLMVTLALLVVVNRGPAAPSISTTSIGSARSPAVDALGMLQQVVGQTSNSVRRGELGLIHAEHTLLSAAMAAVMELTRTLPPERRDSFKASAEGLGARIARLHYFADLKNQPEADQQLKLVIEEHEKVRSHFALPLLQAASVAAEKYVCPMHPEVMGHRTDLCPKCGLELEQQYRLIAGRLNGPLCTVQTVRASIRTETPLAAGRPTEARLALSRFDGSAVYSSDLIESHTKAIHLLLIDSSLTDYHHEHPTAAPKTGDFVFGFTPQKPGPYYAWAEIRPTPMGLLEYAPATIAGGISAEAAVIKTVTNQVVVDGLTFQLSFDGALAAGKPVNGRLRVLRSDETGFDQLEPIMNSFAHLAGFHEDRKTVLHLHPKGQAVTDEKARGGPELEFVFYGAQSGFVRLFVQVQIDGRSKFAPFGLEVN